MSTDTERIDWLERSKGNWKYWIVLEPLKGESVGRADGVTIMQGNGKHDGTERETLRLAIDAAMAREKVQSVEEGK
jgi:hypothetical protein